MPSVNLERARELLSARRIAVVGVSRNEKDFSRAVFRELVRRGYDVVPVSPALDAVEGHPAFPRVHHVAPPPEAVLVLTAPDHTLEVLRDCVAGGVRRVWLHRGAGRGAADRRALTYCLEHGLEVVHDLCPFMALPDTGFPHRVHCVVRTAFDRRA
jgi:predicted CoA-binding protein